MSDADAVQNAMKQFSLLGEEEKRRRILLWVQRPSALAQSVLKVVASEDPEAQIRYLARKALAHLQKTVQKQRSLEDSVSLEDFSREVLKGDTSRATEWIQGAALAGREDVAGWLASNLSNIQDAWVLASGLLALARLLPETSFELIRPYFTHRDARVRASAVEAFGLLQTEEVRPYLFSALKSREARIRSNAIRALKSIERSEVIESVAQMSQAEEDWIRHAAAYALGELRTADILEPLARLLSDRVEAIRKMAQQSMHRLADAGIQEVVQLAAHVKNDGGSETLQDFLQIVRHQQTDNPEDTLDSQDSQERLQEIYRIVAENDSTRYRDLETRLVIEEDNFIKASLILALGRVQQSSAIPLIQSFLKDPVPRLRANAVEALASFHRLEVLPEIILLLDDQNNRVRANAILALNRMRYVDVLTPLESMCRSKDETTRRSALYVLSELGVAQARQFLPILASDASDEFRQSLAEHVKYLEDEGVDTRALAQEMEISLPDEDTLAEEPVAPVEESVLQESSGYQASDFEDFRPDHLSGEDLDGVTLRDYLGANSERKAQMVDYMKDVPSQEHFTILRVAEADKDFQVKVLARIAVTQMRSHGFEEVDLDSILREEGLDAQPSHMFMPQLGIAKEKLEFMGSEPTPALNQDLKRREQSLKAKGNWGGMLPSSPPLLRSLRLDTQEMLAALLGRSLEQLEMATLLYYSPTYKAFLEGQKSLDNVAMENFVQLTTLKSSLVEEEKTDPVSTWIQSSAAPKYLLLLLDSQWLYLFLRQALQYRNAESVKIPLQSIASAELSKDGHFTQLEVKMEKGSSLILPRMLHRHAEELAARLE